VDGKVVATQKMESTVPLILPVDETFDVGSKTGTPVDDRDLSNPVHVHGQAHQADDLARTADADAGGRKEIDGRLSAPQDAK
jgi:arylsulfatase